MQLLTKPVLLTAADRYGPSTTRWPIIRDLSLQCSPLVSSTSEMLIFCRKLQHQTYASQYFNS